LTPDYQRPFVPPSGATQLILVRHGSSAAHDPDVPFDVVGGHSDPSLAPEGHDQSRALAVCLAGEPISAMFISPLRRTAETAAPLAERLGLTPVVVPDFREVHLGAWETDGGFARSTPGRDVLRNRVLDQEEWGLIPGAEDVATLGRRVKFGLDRAATCTGPDAVGVAVIHGGVIAEARHQITRSSPFAFFAIENCSITRVLRHSNGRWALQAFNETSHLRQPRRPHAVAARPGQDRGGSP
jgi:probable phosphoglycerate mutase